MEFAMIGFPPPTELVRPFISLISLYIYIYIYLYSYIYVHLWLTRETRQFQINKDPKDAIFHCLCLSGIDSPLARVPSVKDGTGNVFFWKHPGDTKNCTLTDGYQLLCGFQRNFCFYLFTSSWGCTNQLEIDPSNFGIFHRWNITFYVCLLQVKEGRFIHLIDRRNMGSHRGHFHKFGY